MPQRQPIFNVPMSVIAVLGVMIAIHLIRQFLAVQTDDWFVNVMAFNPARYGQAVFQLDIPEWAHNLPGNGAEGFGQPVNNRAVPGGDIAALTSFVTHMLIHGDAMHLIFNCAWLLACGGAIALRVGTARFLGFTIVTGIAGAFAFLVLNFGQWIPVVGVSGAISGLMAGLLRLMFSAIDQGDVAALRYAPKTVRLTPLMPALQDRRLLAVTALWVGLNAIAALGFGGAQEAGAIAWEAHLGGFFAGLLLFGLFDIPHRKPALHLH